MASFSQVVELLGKVALQMLPGIMLGGGNFSRAIEKAAAKKGFKGAAMTYPGLTRDFIYPITYVANSPTWVNNATLDRNIAPEALRSQTLEEHNRALMEGGDAAEKALMSWWPNEDGTVRQNPTPGSSAVSGVKILPNNKIQVQFRGGGKWYTYKGGKNPHEASMAAAELLQAPSIGRMMNRNGKIAHTSPTDKDGYIDNSVGAWARRHYDPNW
jgi:hypothetical protein